MCVSMSQMFCFVYLGIHPLSPFGSYLQRNSNVCQSPVFLSTAAVHLRNSKSHHFTHGSLKVTERVEHQIQHKMLILMKSDQTIETPEQLRLRVPNLSCSPEQLAAGLNHMAQM